MIYSFPMLLFYFLFCLVPVGIVGFGYWLFIQIRGIPLQKNRSTEFSELVSEGIQSFLRRVLSIVVQMIVYISVVFGAFSFIFRSTVAFSQIFTFLLGGVCLSLGAYLTLKMVPTLVSRVHAQSKGYLTPGLTCLFQSSAAIGFMLFGVVLFGFVVSLVIFGAERTIGYGMGVMVAAFFLRIGGGIYKASADLSHDLSHELSGNAEAESGFDRRNPAAILNVIGDFISKIVGYGSDIISSFMFACMACVLFPLGLARVGLIPDAMSATLTWVPICIVTLSVMVSWLSYFYGKWRLRTLPSNFLLEMVYFSVILGGILTFIVLYFLENRLVLDGLYLGERMHLFPAFVVGLLGATLISFTSEYLTSSRFQPTQDIARETQYGAVVTVFNGVTNGLRSNGFFMVYLLFIFCLSYLFSGLFGIALAALGMLSMTSTILVVKFFSPLATNVLNLSMFYEEDSHPVVTQNARQMDTIGHTTVALGNGFSSGAAVVASFALFVSFVLLSGVRMASISLIDVPFLIGVLMGAGFPFVFWGFLLRGMTQTIFAVLSEVHRQFQDIPYLFEDKARPDIIKASDDQAIYVLKWLTAPGLLLVVAPLALGYLLTAKILLGFVLGVFICAVFQGHYWSNLGDTLSNSRRYIEADHFGGKDSPTYRHAVFADHYGDAFKDLLGPSSTILIKAICIVAMLVIFL